MGDIEDKKLRACIDLMKSFNQTAELLDTVEQSGMVIKPFSQGVQRSLFSMAQVNIAENTLNYDPELLTVDKLVHEAMHVQQYMNSPLLMNSTAFYSGVYHGKPLPENRFKLLSPAAMVEASVAMEMAVWAAQVPVMYDLCQATDNEEIFADFIHDPTSGLSKVYPPLYELGVVKFKLASGQTHTVSLPEEAHTDSLKAKFATVALMGMIYQMHSSTEFNIALKDSYAISTASIIAKNAGALSQHKGFKKGEVAFVGLEDEDIRALGDVWKHNVFENPSTWRAIEKTAPLLDHPKTAECVARANQRFNI